jgi:stage V sporulation protein T
MTFEVDEVAADVVRKVFKLYNQGWGYKRIANYLTDNKIPTPRMHEKTRKDSMGIENKIKAKSAWSIVTIQGIIENDFYIGTLRQGKYKRAKINGDDIKNADNEHIVFEKNHEAIVDERVFNTAQEQLRKRTKSNYRGVKKYDTNYSGFIFCGDCGSPMFSMSRKDIPPAYRCGTYHNRGLKGCTAHHTRVDLLDTLLKSYIRMVRDNSADMIRELEKAIKNEPEYIRSNTSTIDRLEAELECTKTQLKSLAKQKMRELMKHPEHSDTIEETYDEMERELLDLIEGLKSQISMAADKRNNVVNINRRARTVIDIFDAILEKDTLDKTDIGYIVEKIVVFEDRIDIKLRADIDALLKLNDSREPAENSINFNLGIDKTESSRYILSQKVRNQRTKVIGVNVISDGDPLEIYTGSEGEIIFKKYSPIGELGDFAREYAESLAQNVGHITCIVDKDRIIAVSGASKKDFMEKHISDELERVINGRSTHIAQRSDNDFVPILENEPEKTIYNSELITPIISEGDVLGAVVMLSSESKMGEVEGKLAQTAAGFLGKQMEQ